MSTFKQLFPSTICGHNVSRFLPIGIILIAASLAAFVVVFTARPIQAETGIPFGGLSVFIKYCTCNANPSDIAVTVNDLSTTPGSPTNYIYSPGYTILHPYGMIYSTGVWLLGNRQPGGVCRYWVGKACKIWPTDGTMVRVGTSG